MTTSLSSTARLSAMPLVILVGVSLVVSLTLTDVDEAPSAVDQPPAHADRSLTPVIEDRYGRRWTFHDARLLQHEATTDEWLAVGWLWGPGPCPKDPEVECGVGEAFVELAWVTAERGLALGIRGNLYETQNSGRTWLRTRGTELQRWELLRLVHLLEPDRPLLPHPLERLASQDDGSVEIDLRVPCVDYHGFALSWDEVGGRLEATSSQGEESVALEPATVRLWLERLVTTVRTMPRGPDDPELTLERSESHDLSIGLGWRDFLLLASEHAAGCDHQHPLRQLACDLARAHLPPQPVVPDRIVYPDIELVYDHPWSHFLSEEGFEDFEYPSRP
ncbi:MAG: hypothetical protein AAF533_00845 [Acidobacteriota bacterium]